MFDDDTCANDPTDNPTSILEELTHFPSVDYKLIDPVISFDVDLHPSSSNPSKDVFPN